MYHSIPVAFALSSFYLGHIIAAPAALPLNARDAALFPTATTPPASTITAVTLPEWKRDDPDLGSLNDLVIPQGISSSPLPSTGTSTTSSFMFRVTRRATAKDRPVRVVAKDVSDEAWQEDPSFGSLGDLRIPAKISSASANASATSTSFELSPTNPPVGPVVALDN
ncbi:MAG: hypothetical protein Q9211_005287 [Gyalolechia sp. 1 TL-2023]